MTASAPPIRNILTVDVEDYFQVEAFANTVPRSSWDFWPSRVVENTRVILDLFDRHDVKATFFFLGWVAKKFPKLVDEVRIRGHEPACHSFWHRPVYSLTPNEFREDTRLAKEVIEQACGTQVLGYRAPSWTITNESMWALDVLAEEGFVYDSSIYPIHHDICGVPGAHRFPYTLTTGKGHSLREFPPSTARFGRFTLPVAGGGYLRILPFRMNEWAFRQITEQYRQGVVVYFHPWEIDPDQPRIRGKLRSSFRHYTNLRKMKGRLETLLSKHSFCEFRDLLNSKHGTSQPATIDLDHRSNGAGKNVGSRQLPYALPAEPSAVAQTAVGILDREAAPALNGALVPKTARVILAYHEVCAEPSPYIYACSREQLTSHLKFLSSTNQGRATIIKPWLLTFDDGHISNYRYALPLLEESSQKAIFFVIVDWMGVRAPYMNWAHLRELVALGHRVASHGWSHLPLTRCSPAQTWEELEKSKLTLEDHLGVAVDSISVPHGRWNNDLLRICAQVGYRHIYTSNAWMRSRPFIETQIHGRFMVRKTTDAAALDRLLNLTPARKLVGRGKYGAKELTRRVIGDQRYHRLWGLFAGRYDPDAMH
ncbi:MAG: XrtA system polysaccharide deacetylase [Candidatus Acidiferrales bacterium]